MSANFQIYLNQYSSSVDEWAASRQVTDLPVLTPEQKEAARKFGATEEQYARMVLVGQVAEKRLLERAEALGSKVEKILGGLGSDYRLVAIKREIDNATWILRIETPEAVKDVSVSWELTDDLLDSESRENLEFLKNKILRALGRKDVLPK